MGQDPLRGGRGNRADGWIRRIDAASGLVGRASGWLIVFLTLMICVEVFKRYVLGQPGDWTFDLSLMAFGTLFMLGGAYALAQNAHVRGDFMYGSLPPRLQAGLDLALYGLFYFPGVIALAWAGWDFAADSWAIREGSAMVPDGPPQYPFKTIIPIAGLLLIAQGVAEVLRCIVCLRAGSWPARDTDIAEVDPQTIRERLAASRREAV